MNPDQHYHVFSLVKLPETRWVFRKSGETYEDVRETLATFRVNDCRAIVIYDPDKDIHELTEEMNNEG